MHNFQDVSKLYYGHLLIVTPINYNFSLFVTDGKFHQLPSGDLLIHNLEFSDQFPTYRCRTMHRLSKQIVTSSPANVRIAGKGEQSTYFVELTFANKNKHRNNLKKFITR